MSKNIVIFCDGTWNSPADEEFGVPSVTNVRTLYRACQDFAESDGKQVVWYQSGIGSLGNAFKRSFEGATGWGIGNAIRRGYTIIARHYEPGDKIYLFGFSRGAFAARSIAGMIQQVGLLADPTPYEVKKAYQFYEEIRYEYQNIKTYYQKKGSLVTDARGPGNVCIHFIGVWDTVGSLGFSFWGWSFNLRFFQNAFHDLSPNNITSSVYHALAMDEIRTSFMPSLWEYPDKDKSNEPPAGRVEQAWFRGVHSDIGGGYAERGLSDITLDWMARKATKEGLLLRKNALIADNDPKEEKRKQASLFPKPTSRIHRSFQGPLWTSVGGWPRWYPPLSHTPCTDAEGYLHRSVFERQEKCIDSGSSEVVMSRLAIGQTKSVVVRADHLWNFTGFILEEEGTYRFRTEGIWQDGNKAPVGPEGESDDTKSILKRWGRHGRRAPKARQMQLIGVVNHPRNWRWMERRWYEALHYLFVADPPELVETLFPINTGTSITIKSKETGIFWAFANDWWKMYDNNTGSVTLWITREA